MKKKTLLFALAAAVLCAGPAFAETPATYRQKLLGREVPQDYKNFCKDKDSTQDCIVTQLFLDDIDAGIAPKDGTKSNRYICPSGTHIKYSGGPPSDKVIAANCTLPS